MANNIKADLSLKSKVFLAFIVAFFSFLGTTTTNCINVAIDRTKEENALALKRQDAEIKDSINEVKSLIELYEEMRGEGAQILIELRDKTYPLTTDKLINKDKVIQNVDHFLELFAKITKSYFKLKSFYSVQLSEEILTVSNGFTTIIFSWLQADTLQRSLTVPHYSSIFWLPKEELIVPPKTREECVELNKTFDDMLRKQIDQLMVARKELIKGKKEIIK